MKSLYLLKSTFVCTIIFAAVSANAQLVAPNVFLQGKYVEVGITPNGDYGTNTQPSGYHGNCGGVGFVADPAMDGWTVGVPPYEGDYFLPGMPFEGWELQVNGQRMQAYNSGGGTTFTGPLTGSGSNVSYTTSGSELIGTWLGTFDSLQVKQETILDTLGLYFRMKITLTNTASTAKNNIYYLRTLDPDNDEKWPGGGFTTFNNIDHQVPDTTIVSATGLSSSAPYLGLGTADTPATCLFYTAWPLKITVDLDSILRHGSIGTPATYGQGSWSAADIAIGLVNYVAHLSPADSATDSVYRTTSTAHKHPANSASFDFFYAFSPAAALAAIQATSHQFDSIKTTPPSGLGVNNINTTSEVKVYPNPSKNVINITGLNKTDQISIYDMMGRQVNQQWPVNHEGVNTFSMNNMATGAYILIVQDANGDIKARVPVRKL